MPLSSKLVSVIVGSLLVVTFILYVVSNAVPAWSKRTEDGTASFTYGLWRFCLKHEVLGQCVPVPCPGALGSDGFCSKILAGRAFMTLACIMSGIVAICLFLYTIGFAKGNPRLLLAIKGLVFACLLMGIIGVAVGGNATMTLGGMGAALKMGPAAIVGIIAIIVNFVGAIGALFIRNEQSD